MPTYTCELCKKTFEQKIDYERHKAKKAPCISVEEIKKIVVKKQDDATETAQLKTIFDFCLNVLRDCGTFDRRQSIENDGTFNYFEINRTTNWEGNYYQ